MKVKIVNWSGQPLPAYATPLSAGMDLRACLEAPVTLGPLERALVPTGLYIALPPGFEAQVRPRSGLAAKHGVTVLNTPGTIDDFYYNDYTIEQLDAAQMDQLIDTQIARGDATVKNAQMQKHRRYSMPLSAFILTIIAVSLCSKKRRGGMGWNIAVGLALGFSYILFEQVSKMFVVTDTLPAGIATWIPNILYAVIAAVLYILAPK